MSSTYTGSNVRYWVTLSDLERLEWPSLTYTENSMTCRMTLNDLCETVWCVGAWAWWVQPTQGAMWDGAEPHGARTCSPAPATCSSTAWSPTAGNIYTVHIQARGNYFWTGGSKSKSPLFSSLAPAFSPLSLHHLFFSFTSCLSLSHHSPSFSLSRPFLSSPLSFSLGGCVPWPQHWTATRRSLWAKWAVFTSC